MINYIRVKNKTLCTNLLKIVIVVLEPYPTAFVLVSFYKIWINKKLVALACYDIASFSIFRLWAEVGFLQAINLNKPPKQSKKRIYRDGIFEK